MLCRPHDADACQLNAVVRQYHPKVVLRCLYASIRFHPLKAIQMSGLLEILSNDSRHGRHTIAYAMLLLHLWHPSPEQFSLRDPSMILGRCKFDASEAESEFDILG